MLKKVNVDCGLLIIRIGVGIVFMFHGWPKMKGGPDMWEKLGSAMGVIGLGFAPVFWGFMAAFAEFGGGLLLALGLAFRPASFLLAFTMLIATVMHISKGDNFGDYSHALVTFFVFAGLMVSGPGKYRLTDKLA